jgi:isocitrate dehydrogenase
MVNDRIADSIFQQIQTRPDEYSILATMNLNGDYLSDAAAAIVGGLGMEEISRKDLTNIYIGI